MADENDKFWTRAQPDIRRAMGLIPLTPEAAERECKQSKPANMSEGDIISIMEFVLSWGEKGGLGSSPPPVPDTVQEPVYAEAETMDAELMELVNRNRGEQDSESEALLKKYRAEALGNDPEHEKKDGDSKNQTGPGGGANTAGTGS
jgi:hypothetical protein